MDDLLDNPATLRKELEEGLKKEQEEGELDQEEVEEIERAMNPPPPRPHRKEAREPFTMRGEGGSGEKPQPALRPVEEHKGEQSEGEEEEGEEEERGSIKGADYDEGEEGVVIPGGSTQSSGRPSYEDQLEELRAYSEEQFKTLSGFLHTLSQRVSYLEVRSSTSIPLAAPLAGSAHRRTMSPPSSHTRTKSGLGVPKASPPPDAVDPDKVRQFLRLNPTYPSLSRVRKAKLAGLGASLGLDGSDKEVKASEWTVEGLCDHFNQEGEKD